MFLRVRFAQLHMHMRVLFVPAFACSGVSANVNMLSCAHEGVRVLPILNYKHVTGLRMMH